VQPLRLLVVEAGDLLAQQKNDDYIKNDRANFLAAIGRAQKLGVKITVGIDLGGYGVDPTVYAREFAVLHEAGMTPMEAIQAGTRVNAELLRWDDRLGTIEAGKLADIVVLDRDIMTVPERRILDTEVVYTIVGGKVAYERPRR